MNHQLNCRKPLPNMIRALTASCAVLVLALCQTSASAGMLMLPAPDIYVSNLSLLYNAGPTSQKIYGKNLAPNELFAKGYASTIELPGGAVQNLFIGNGMMMPAQFTLNAFVDSSGNLTSGSFSVMGSTTQSSGTIVSLLAGTLTDLNAAAFNSAGILEFNANTTGGQFSNIFGSEIVMSIGSLGAGKSFAATFMVIGSASADIGRPVPEPTAACLWFVGAAMFGMRRRRA